MTNEFVFGYTYVGFPNVFEDPSKVNRTNVGLQLSGTLQERRGADSLLRRQGLDSREAALVFNPGGFEAGGASAGLYADK